MAKVELQKELQAGFSRVTLVGTAKVTEKSFSGITQKEGSTWRQVNDTIGVDTGDKNIVYGRIWGGYKTDNPVVYARTVNATADGKKRVAVPWDKRNDEEYIKNADLDTRDFLKAGITKDENGKLIIKEFMHEIDFSDYLKENLADGQEIRVTAVPTYQEYKGETQRQYSIRSVYLNEPYEKDGETKQTPKQAKLRQVYLVEKDSLTKNWERELEKDGKTIVTLYAPHYVGKMTVNNKSVDVKRNVAFVQAVTIRANSEDTEALEKTKKIVKKLFVVKRDVVREVGLIVDINDGYEETDKVELNDEMRELIEMGMLTEEDIKNQTTIRGNRISELVYDQPIVRTTDSGIALQLEDKYSVDVLLPPVTEEDDSTDDLFGDDVDLSSGITDDECGDLFG